jgi:hypothetical protein
MRRENPQQYAENVFTIAAYNLTYSKPIYPPIITSNLDETPEFEDSELGLVLLADRTALDDQCSEGTSYEDSSSDEVLPPNVKKNPDRPRNKRMRGNSEVELVRKRHYGRCIELGHNSRSCANPPVSRMADS